MKASDRAYTALRDDIVEWRLPPGTLLGEVEQSERLGISRTPLREALARLTADGLASAQRGRGVVVSDISLAHIDELFELREALESKAAALAALRGDHERFADLRDRFAAAPELLTDDDPQRHEYYALAAELDAAINDAIGNSYLTQSLEGLRVHLTRVRRLAKDDAARLRQAATEHAAIAGAIADGNAHLAAAATAVHLNNSLNHIKNASAQPHPSHPDTHPEREV
ncbi:GntR family transcriptional regulator [Sinomonas cyclohexanicum]|uniref:GntR family transcriptional regulator n=1 Tax=Sinomonas cyclohexanicum TaxID=322009 RepID=A0ABM7PUC7_SINCY|nr:GntR family transcriptional regulator [Corynebacterium cyclohexanicum]BCT75857.1 GntR family transcriptional regulator [Corynebacterium cyclohexanicum]